jgi:hypothetical protein
MSSAAALIQTQEQSFLPSTGHELFLLKKGQISNYIGYILLWIVFILAFTINSTFHGILKDSSLLEECQFSASDIANIVSIATGITYFTAALLYVITVSSFPSMQTLNWFVLIGGGIFIFASISFIQNILNSKSKECQKSIPNLQTMQTLGSACMVIIAIALIIYFLHSQS